MKLTINRESLLQALTAPAAIARSATVDYLACVLISTHESDMTIEGTNLNESVRCQAVALVEAEGCVLVPGKTLLDIVKSLPSAAVAIYGLDHKAIIECGNAAFEIPALNPGDFPAFQHVEDEKTLIIPISQLSDAVRICKSFAATRNTKIEVFKGVHIVADGSVLEFDATDSYRVARVRMECEHGDFNSVIPLAFIDNVLGTKCGGNVRISYSKSQIKAETDAGTFTTRVLEGRFPAIDMFFREPPTTRASFDVSAVHASAKRALAIGGSKPAKLSMGNDVEIARYGGDTGSYSECIEHKSLEGSCYVGVNAQYLCDALSVAPDDEVSIELINPTKQIVIRSGFAEMAIMPVRMDQ